MVSTLFHSIITWLFLFFDWCSSKFTFAMIFTIFYLDCLWVAGIHIPYLYTNNLKLLRKSPYFQEIMSFLCSVPFRKILITPVNWYFAERNGTNLLYPATFSVGYHVFPLAIDVSVRPSDVLWALRSGNILSFLLPLFQEGQLSVTGESMCTKYWLTA